MIFVKNFLHLFFTLILTVCLCGINARGLDELQASIFTTNIPQANKNGYCYTFKVNECEVVASLNADTIDFFCVRGPDRNTCQATATKLATLFQLDKSRVLPVKGKEKSAAVLITNSAKYPTLKISEFTNWSGSNVSYTLVSKASKCTIEVQQNLIDKRKEFRIVKGKSNQKGILYDIAEFSGITPVQSCINTEKVKSSGGHTVLYDAYDQSFQIAIWKQKYYAGTPETITRSIKEKSKERLVFPTQILTWEDIGDISLSEEDAEKKGLVNISLLNNQFPERQTIGTSSVFRVDNSLVIAIADTEYYNEVQLILVRSKKNQADAVNTATRLAGYLSEKCVVKRFEGTEPSAAILMPKATSLNHYLSSTMNILFGRGKIIDPDKIKFIGWKGSLLVTRVIYGEKGNENEVEVTINTRSCYNNRGIELKPLTPGVDIRRFLHSGRMWGFDSHDFQAAETLQKELKCEEIVLCDGSSQNSFILIKLENGVYRAGNLKFLQELQKSGFAADDYDYPETALPWPIRVLSSTISADYVLPTSKDNTTTTVGKREPGVVYIADLFRLFPEMVRDEHAYLIRLDKSLIIIMANKMNEVQLILVRSQLSQADAVKTATRLARLLSAGCRVRPFEGNEPSAVIHMGEARGLGYNQFLNAYLISPQNNPHNAAIKFIGWKGALLIIRISSTTPGAVGEVELTLKTWRFSNANGVEYKVVSGNVDILKFLFSEPARLWGEYTKPSESDRKKLIEEMGCKDVLSFSEQNWGGRLTILSYGDQRYRSGWYSELKLMKPTGMGTKDYNFPLPLQPWPSKGVADLVDALPKPQEITMPADPVQSQPTGHKRTSPQKPAPLSPSQLLKRYVEILRNL